MKKINGKNYIIEELFQTFSNFFDIFSETFSENFNFSEFEFLVGTNRMGVG